jgi:hypothetical protein
MLSDKKAGQQLPSRQNREGIHQSAICYLRPANITPKPCRLECFAQTLSSGTANLSLLFFNRGAQ